MSKDTRIDVRVGSEVQYEGQVQKVLTVVENKNHQAYVALDFTDESGKAELNNRVWIKEYHVCKY